MPEIPSNWLDDDYIWGLAAWNEAARQIFPQAFSWGGREGMHLILAEARANQHPLAAKIKQEVDRQCRKIS